MFKKVLVNGIEIFSLSEINKLYLEFSLALKMRMLERNFKVAYNARKNI